MAEATQGAAEPPRLPRITIQFCTQCKWMLRAAYYAQELLSTFSLSLGEVSLQPATGGVFAIDITTTPTPTPTPTTTTSTSPSTSRLPARMSLSETSTAVELAAASASARVSISGGSADDSNKTGDNKPQEAGGGTTNVAVEGEGEGEGEGGPAQKTTTVRLWDRKTDGGFPETKELKRRVRDVIQPGRDLGHVDRDYSVKGGAAVGEKGAENEVVGEAKLAGKGGVCSDEKCEDCE